MQQVVPTNLTTEAPLPEYKHIPPAYDTWTTVMGIDIKVTDLEPEHINRILSMPTISRQWRQVLTNQLKDTQ